jgi:hypothetical protein
MATSVATFIEEWRSGNHAPGCQTIVVPFNSTIDQVEDACIEYPFANHVVFDIPGFDVSQFEMVVMISNILVDDDKIVTIRMPASHAILLAGYEFNNKVMIQLVIECLHDSLRNDRLQVVVSSLVDVETFTIPMTNLTRALYSNIPPVAPVVEEEEEDDEDSRATYDGDEDCDEE